MKAVIMAGGEGTRLRPLTCTMPKPMVPVVNKPMMEHILDLLKRHGFQEIAGTLWYLPEMIKDYFGDGSAYQVSMDYYVETKPLGTAGSVKNAKAFLDQPFIVVSGDCLTDIDLSAAVGFHRKKGALATLVLTRVANPLSYGVVITNDEGRITQFLEKPSWSEVFSDTVNTGIYILEPEVLDAIPDQEKYDFSQNLFPKLLAQQAPLYGYVAEGYWSDVGNLEVYRQAQLDCLDGKVAVELSVPQQNKSWIAPDAALADDIQITGPVYIGSGARIGPGCRLGAYTIIGDYSQLDAEVDIKRATLWQRVRVGMGCEIRGAILAHNTCLGAKSRVYEGSVIGEKTLIGSQTIIDPNVKIWPSKQIAKGSRLTQSVVWGFQNEPSLFSQTGVKGDIRSSLTPEMIVKFALAYGSFTGRGKSVVVSADQSSVGRLAKRALICGLMAAGVNVYDVGTVSGNLTRFGVAHARAQGALHCQAVADHEDLVNIQCWDHQGYWLSKAEQRKIENIFWREDFPRAGPGEIGSLAYIPGLTKQYIASVAKLYAPHLKGFEINIDADEQELAKLVKDFLKAAGCTLTEHDPELVVRIRGDQWEVADRLGTALTGDQWWELFVKGQRQRQQNKVALPAHVSSFVADAAKACDMEVAWTKTDPRAWMEVASELGNIQLDHNTNIEFFPYIEPLVTLGEALSFLKTADKPLREVCSLDRPRVHKSVFCPWQSIGKVMRSMIITADPGRTEFHDGIRYHCGQGWAFIVPDGDEPLFHIYSEAGTSEEADALAQAWAERIENLLGGA
ncbi:MAG: sugar phosphate nucleotidyltransferase [Bacillota bacterium]|jgi:mannose-1-phosphate guanylyltransferase/phosphomannomutase|nr:sugar phosphate nucleotidyltransferase [Bacillota bacterium]